MCVAESMKLQIRWTEDLALGLAVTHYNLNLCPVLVFPYHNTNSPLERDSFISLHTCFRCLTVLVQNATLKVASNTWKVT